MLISMAQGEAPKGEMKYMSEFQETTTTSGTPRWVGLAVAILGGISLLGLGVGLSALNQARSIEQSTQATVRQANEALNQRLAKADEINQQLQSDVKVVTDKLKVTHADLVAARKQNKYATVAVDQKVTNLATSVKAELATKANNEDVNKLNGDVSGVKSDLDATKNSIQMARSEMGTLISLRAIWMLFLVASRSLFTPLTSPISLFTSSLFALVASSALTEVAKLVTFWSTATVAYLFCLRAATRSACVTLSLSVTTLTSLCSCWLISSAFASLWFSASLACLTVACVDCSILLA